VIDFQSDMKSFQLTGASARCDVSLRDPSHGGIEVILGRHAAGGFLGEYIEIPLVPMFRTDGQSYHAAGAVVPNIRFLPGDKLTSRCGANQRTRRSQMDRAREMYMEISPTRPPTD
jgi:hypothetical protein